MEIEELKNWKIIIYSGDEKTKRVDLVATLKTKKMEYSRAVLLAKEEFKKSQYSLAWEIK
jgi:hypothetical protein